MTYSYIFFGFTRLATRIARHFSVRRLPAATLALMLVLSAGLVPGGTGAALAQDKAAPPTVAAVNINKADAAAIASSLKGVGTARAKEIVRYRDTYGPFTSVDELADVKGIGKSTLDENRARITLE